MFRTLGRAAYTLRWIWMFAGAAVLLTGVLYGVNVFPHLKTGGMIDPHSASAREATALLKNFPNSRVTIVLIASSPTLTVDQLDFENRFSTLISEIQLDRSAPYVQTYYSTNSDTFVSQDRHTTFALIGCSGDQDAAYLRIKQLIEPSDLNVTLGGPAAADYEINAEVARDLPKLGAVSLPLLGIMLIFIFRSPIAAALPLLIGAMSVLGAFAVTRVLAHFLDISVFAANIIGLLGLGLAIDYSLLMVSRFRDEIGAGRCVQDSVAICLETAGEAIFLSGTTVTISLLGLTVFPEMFLRSMGIGGAVAVMLAMVSSMTVLPAILSALGPHINLLTLPLPMLEPHRQERIWRRSAAFMVRNAAFVLPATLAVLLAAGIPFLHVKFANAGAESLPMFFSSRKAADLMSKSFSATQSEPVEILLSMPGPIAKQTQIDALIEYVGRIRALPGVTGVDSIVSDGLPGPSSEIAYLVSNPTLDPRLLKLVDHLVCGRKTLIEVDFKGGSEGAPALRLVSELRVMHPPTGSSVLIGGDSAELTDRVASLRQHLPYAIGIIFAATFVVLLLMLSSLVIPIKAIVLNTLSLSAAFGTMTWIFQDGHLQRVLNFTSSRALDPTLPVLIFAIAFGLATDYEVFLVSRIREEYLRTGSNSEAIVIGVEKTGGIITSAGLLLVVVVAAFGLSDILAMKEMGVGLAIAVVIDAAVVRTFLVPAAMQLFGDINWWMPGRKLGKGDLSS